MYEGFNLQILRNMRPNLPNLIQRQLPGGNNALRALLMPKTKGTVIGIICLGTYMTFNLRTDLFRNLKYTRIRNNKCIRSNFLKFPEVFPHTVQIFIVCQYIGCHIDLYAMFMGKKYPFFHVLHGKVLCLRPQTKCFTADIDSVRTENNCYFQNFQAAGRHQQFRFSHTYLQSIASHSV